jgi:drug/metabolite transporter (DMT)-like permease
MKIGLRFVPPALFVLHRFVISAVVLLPFFLILRSRIPRDRSTVAKLIILCLVFVSIIIAQAFGLSEESSGIGAVLTYTQPLFVFCLAVPFLKEEVTKTKLLGITIGFVGVLVLFIDKTGSFTLNSAFVMLLGAFLWAVAVVHYKKFLNHVDPLITHFSQLSVGVVPLVFLSATANTFIFPSDMLYIGVLVVSSAGALALGNVIWFFLLKEEEATTISGSSLIIPAVAMLFGWQLLGESFSTVALFGSALTLAGVCLLNIRKKAPATSSPHLLK